MRIKKELTVVRTSFIFGSNVGNYYLTDGETTYLWVTTSEKAYEEMEEGTTHLCTFTDNNIEWINPLNDETYKTIKNVRF